MILELETNIKFVSGRIFVSQSMSVTGHVSRYFKIGEESRQNETQWNEVELTVRSYAIWIELGESYPTI